MNEATAAARLAAMLSDDQLAQEIVFVKDEIRGDDDLDHYFWALVREAARRWYREHAA